VKIGDLVRVRTGVVGAPNYDYFKKIGIVVRSGSDLYGDGDNSIRVHFPILGQGRWIAYNLLEVISENR